LVASRGLCMLHGHGVCNSVSEESPGFPGTMARITASELERRTKITATPRRALTECLQKIFDSLPMRRLAQPRRADLVSDVPGLAPLLPVCTSLVDDATARPSV
jgi:hypothetical protein